MLRSWSQYNQFKQCEYSWYLNKIKKIQLIQDTCHMDAGSVIHHVLQKFYEKQIIELDKLKEFFEQDWKEYKLDNSMLKNRKDEFWLMVIHGLNENFTPTSCEYKLINENFIGYLDIIDTTNDAIYDWKSSTRMEENEIEYKNQLLLYSAMYEDKFGRLPKICGVRYLKYTGSKGTMDFIPQKEETDNIKLDFEKTSYKMQQIEMEIQEPKKCEECFFFCSYKEYCKQDNNTIKFKIHLLNNYLYLEGQIDELLEKGIIKKFSYELKDAHWIKKRNPMINTTVCFWSRFKHILPISMLEGLKKTLNDYALYTVKKLDLEIIEKRNFNNDVILMPDKIQKELRDYQVQSVNLLKEHKTGILALPTGSGKTEIAIEFIRQIPYKTLFLVDRLELLRQTKERIEKELNIKVGEIHGNTVDIQHITIATIQTINKRIKEFGEYLSTIRVAFFDECHKIASNSYIKVSRYLINSEFRLGLSATPYRTDGNDMKINSVCGYKIFEIKSEDLINRNLLETPQINFIKDFLDIEDKKTLNSLLDTGLINPTIEYHKYYNVFVVQNEKRNQLIQKIITKFINTKVLILVKIVQHGEILSKILNAPYLCGDTKEEDRKILLNDFKNGKLNMLIGTMSIFQEGLDIPQLGVLINASGNKSDVSSIQTLGRLLRKHENKQCCVYYDFIDEGILFNASRSRIRAFRKENYEVGVIKYGNV
jgi:superfamily II DNA or RNA helicase/RecB family exonuclease